MKTYWPGTVHVNTIFKEKESKSNIFVKVRVKEFIFVDWYTESTYLLT